MASRSPTPDGLALAPNAAGDVNNPAATDQELQAHRSWGRWETFATLPNGSGNLAGSPAYDKMRPGDVAFVEGTVLSQHVLADRGTLSGGDAVWVTGGAAASGPIILVTSTTRTVFATIGAALAAAVSGDVVEIAPGSYAESVSVPAGVQLSGADGVNSALLTGALATGTRVTLGDDATLANVNVTLPSDAVPAVAYTGATLATVKDVGFTGAGASGVGFRNSGTGTSFLDRVSYFSGVAAVLVDVTAGTVQANELFVFGGTLTDIARVVGGSFNFVNFSVALPVVAVDGVEVGAGGAVRGQVGRLLGGVTNALHITSDTSVVDLDGVDLKGMTADILADPAVVSASVSVTGGQLSTDRVDVSGGLRASGGWLVSYLDSKAGDAALRVEGELSVGAAEKPAESVFGEGDSYTEGMVVVTTDGTAGAISDGGNLTNVSVAAASAAGSTFTFQGVTAGHAIMFGSSRADASSVLKHWGVKLLQTTAAVEVTPRSFVVEIWDGAAWVDVGVMATHSSTFARYADELFIRGSDSEHLRFGIDSTTTWATKLISGSTLFWSRVRIITTVTTAPVFEQSKLSTSRFEANGDGTNTFHGLSRFRRTVMSAGNIFGETGGVAAFTMTVGSGGVPTGWGHPVKNSNLNGNGDAVYIQFVLPRGIDTSFPLEFRVYYLPTNTGLADVVMIMSVLPLEAQGILEADPAGGIVPVARTLANTATLTAAAGTSVTKTIDSATGTKIQTTDYSPYDVRGFYEGDIVLVRLELDNDGVGNANIGVVAVEVAGVNWTHGERL